MHRPSQGRQGTVPLWMESPWWPGRLQIDDFLQRHPTTLRPTRPMPGAEEVTSEGGERPEFAWDLLVPELVHPMKVAIVEALTFVGLPLSANDICKMTEDALSVSYVSYHVQTLVKAEAITCVRTRRVRGAIEKFYVVRPDLVRG